MLTQIETRYLETLRSFKPNKLSQWLDEWEATLVDCIKYDLPEVKNGRWLRDLARLIRPISELYYEQFMEDADDGDKSKPQEFRRVARRLRERLVPQKGGRIMRGNAFQTSFGESPEGDSAAAVTPEAEQAPPRRKGRKRTGTQSVETEKASKKAVSDCPACGLRGHSLEECWCIFIELKPEGITLPEYRVRKAEKTVKKDTELKKLVEKIREKMKMAKNTKTVRFEDEE
jgi:hypothetical protein